MDHSERHAWIRRRGLTHITWLTVGFLVFVVLQMAVARHLRDLHWGWTLESYVAALVFVGGGGILYDYFSTRKREP